MKRGIFLFVGLIYLTGCAKLQHLDQLLTLKDLSEEQDKLGRHIEQQDQKFELLVQAVKANQLERYPGKRHILKRFGEPVYSRPIERNGQALELWLYRYSTQFFDSEKVYLYFDSSDRLVDWEYEGGDHGQSKQKTETKI